jgi:hypothetical protein
VDYLDLLADPAYRHMLLNHIPIVGLALAIVALATGLLMRERVAIFIGLALVMLTTGMALPISRFGDAAYPAIYDTLNGHGRAWLDHHAEVAETWLPLLLANAAFALLAIALGTLKKQLLIPMGILVLLLGLGSLAGASSIARSGGQIQHPEFRLQATPD